MATDKNVLQTKAILDDAHIARLDRILFTEGKLGELMAWKSGHAELVRQWKPVLKEGLIAYHANGTEFAHIWQYFRSPSEDDEGEIVLLAIPPNRKRFPLLVFQFTAFNAASKLTANAHWVSSDLERITSLKSVEEGVEILLGVYCALMAYMEHFREVRERVQTLSHSAVTKKKAKHGKRGTRTVRAARVEYLLSFPASTSEEQKDKKERERHTESWGVRGHMRTYQSGRTAWIKPHVKGRGAVTPKNYKV